MKKLFLFIVVLFIASAFSNAQSLLGKTPEQTAANKTKKLNNELSTSKYLPLPLSTDQEAKVKASFLEYEQQAHPIRKKHESSADKTKMRQELKTYQDKLDSQLKSILTADQYTKYQNIEKPKGEPGYFAD